MIVQARGFTPKVGKAAFIAENAAVCGDVDLGEDVSIWFGASIRAEVAPITIGARSNVQDNATLHADFDLPVAIGEGVSIGHNAVIHGCRIEDGSLIGMHATVLNGAVVGRESIVAAGALVKEGQVVPARSLVVGIPGKVIRTLDDDALKGQEANAAIYVEEARGYAQEQARL